MISSMAEARHPANIMKDPRKRIRLCTTGRGPRGIGDFLLERSKERPNVQRR